MTEETTAPAVKAPWSKKAVQEAAPEVTKTEETAPEVAAPVQEAAPEVAEGEVMVTVSVPKAFNLTMSPSQTIRVPAGVQEMTLAQAEHWYSKAHGVSIYNPSKKG